MYKIAHSKLAVDKCREDYGVCDQTKKPGPARSVKTPADGPETGSRPTFCSHALVGVPLAIDIAVVAESPGSVIKQKLMANSARSRHNKYRARVNLVIAWRDHDWRCYARPLGRIFSVHEQSTREKSR